MDMVGELSVGYLLVASLLFVAATIAAWFAVYQTATQRHAKDTFAIVGLSGAGKTALFTQIQHGQPHCTHTSMSANHGSVQLDSQQKPWQVVDIPGHPRLRPLYQAVLEDAQGLIFMVDSTHFTRQVRDVADCLYGVLALPKIAEQRTPVAIVCNKRDLLTALPANNVQRQLESEINRLRTTRGAALESHTQEASQRPHEFLGYEDKDFHFDHLPNPVVFIEFSTKNDTPEKVLAWMADIAY
ncbi:hypothetical protein H4R34_003589 [Dimargaris verticillata]|uniref:Signal recognition particle receptor subunit beta n=1 Tax=Dimargaris verticillata TaxID=2761393 RepID=A0A9W8E832_9FUNG|nr:hypothetical protein H4R34_003589 [Dimargaris verticillata]